MSIGSERDEAERRILSRIFRVDPKPEAGTKHGWDIALTDNPPIFTEGDVEKIIKKVLDRIGDQEIREAAIT